MKFTENVAHISKQNRTKFQLHILNILATFAANFIPFSETVQLRSFRKFVELTQTDPYTYQQHITQTEMEETNKHFYSSQVLKV